MTSERRRVYALARAYSDRVKQLQRTSTRRTTHDAEHFDVAAASVHRGAARARSVSVERRLAPVVVYR